MPGVPSKTSAENLALIRTRLNAAPLATGASCGSKAIVTSTGLSPRAAAHEA